MSSLVALDPSYDLKIEISANKKVIGQHRLLVSEGKTGTIEQTLNGKKAVIELSLSEGELQKKKGKVIKFVVGIFETTGKANIVSNGQVLASKSNKARISAIGKDGKELMALFIVFRRL